MAKEKLKRIGIVLNLANKEDREVYDILRKEGNMTWFIRKAVLQFYKGSHLDLQTAEDLRNLITATIQEALGDPDGKTAYAEPKREERMISPEPELAEETDDPVLDIEPEEDQDEDILDDDTMKAIEKMF
jgi:hypothetical protein